MHRKVKIYTILLNMLVDYYMHANKEDGRRTKEHYI